MIITRHNYEEFFLMYVDDELTKEERAAVELFASQNPDLLPELDMLKQTKLPVDETQVFMHKNDLLQNISSIAVENYEEQFLLYVDNELTNDAKEDVEKFVLQHPELQDAFTLLKQTKLESEQIIFEGKESLLRKERDGRIIPLIIRFAVAAAIVGVMAMVWWLTGSDTKVTNNQVAANIDTVVSNDAIDNVATANEKQNIVKPEVATAQQEEAQKNETAATNKPVKSSNTVVVNTGNQNAQKNNVAAMRKDDVPVVAINKPVEETIAKPVEVNVAATDKPDYTVAKNDTKQDNGFNTTVVKNTKPETNKSYVSNAVYKELNTEEEDNREALYVGSLQINKNKVRGLVKKVGGLFAGKAKEAAANEDGKLQIANLELPTN